MKAQHHSCNCLLAEEMQLWLFAVASILAVAVLIGGCRASAERNQDFSARIERWVLLYLAAIDEPPLEEIPGQSFRFFWLPAYRQPISVRANCVENRCSIAAKRMAGKGGAGPSELVDMISRTLSSEEWLLLEKQIQKAAFWEISREEFSIEMGPEDASLWVLEGKCADRYRVWAGWSAMRGEDPGIRRLGLQVLELSESGFEISEF